ncbi:MAG: hypothetical protein H8E15_04665 [Planctomycetes bacterium]|nr:hypothetical protein [Planctomycetota bacterium]
MESASKNITLTLSAWDRHLIRCHGFPFPEIKAAIDAVPDSVDLAEVSCNRYYVELLLGDLARSINQCKDGMLIDRLNDLFECIEMDAAEQ